MTIREIDIDGDDLLDRARVTLGTGTVDETVRHRAGRRSRRTRSRPWLGFNEIGEQVDEVDGLEWVFRLG